MQLTRPKAKETGDNEELEESSSWTSTIGTRSAFSLSLPTGESERTTDEGREEEDEESSTDESRRTSTSSSDTSNTSADFSSFRDLSEISEHTTMRPRAEDIEWMNAARQYHHCEPVFRKKPFKAALRIRSRRPLPQLHWRRLYHQWSIRQAPKAYQGTDVLNPYIKLAKNGKCDVDLEQSDMERGIFYLKSTNC